MIDTNDERADAWDTTEVGHLQRQVERLCDEIDALRPLALIGDGATRMATSMGKADNWPGIDNGEGPVAFMHWLRAERDQLAKASGTPSVAGRVNRMVDEVLDLASDVGEHTGALDDLLNRIANKHGVHMHPCDAVDLGECRECTSIVALKATRGAL